MIAGIGVDIFSMRRLAALSDKEGFFREVLTAEELSGAPQGECRDAFCAELCATKEAVLKALGCGLHPGSPWHDITVFEGFRVGLSGRIRELAERRSIGHIHISSSSSVHSALAIALLETNTPRVTQ